MSKRVLLWMSWWIDSTICAYLLKEQGFIPVWLFMKYWVDPLSSNERDENKCCSIEAMNQVQSTCSKLGMEFHVENKRLPFYETVVKHYLALYWENMTPNPCMKCNEKIKWWDLDMRLMKYNCQYMATGHYAIIKYLNWKPYITPWIDKLKDQSYFLSVLDHKSLEKIILPIGLYMKKDIFALAKQYWEDILYSKPESQWVCFYWESSYIPFLKRYKPELFAEWEFKYIGKSKGKIIEKHKWIPYYTIGQRRWLPGWFSKPIYVIWIDYKANTVILWDDEDLWKDKIYIKSPFFIDDALDNVYVKIRHLWTMKKIKNLEKISEDEYCINLESPLRAITSGQYAVLYKDGIYVVWNWMIMDRS